jgi:hypothetical protein
MQGESQRNRRFTRRSTIPNIKRTDIPLGISSLGLKCGWSRVLARFGFMVLVGSGSGSWTAPFSLTPGKPAPICFNCVTWRQLQGIA